MDIKAHYTIALSNVDPLLINKDGDKKPGTPEYRECVSRCIQAQFQDLGGNAKIVVDDQKVEVSWANTDSIDLEEYAVKKLEQHDYQSGILFLELLLSAEKDNPSILYNLGMALSDIGKIEKAITYLERALSLEPDLNNARIALGVAHSRIDNIQEAHQYLGEAVRLDPENPWAQRNLGGILLKLGKSSEAIPHLEKAVELLPNDQNSWFGLAQAYEEENLSDYADSAYKKAVEADEYSQIAEMARNQRSKIAQKNFKDNSRTLTRPDAVMYCLAAIKKFNGLPRDKVQGIAFEIAMLGRKGFEVNNPSVKYTLRSMEGEFTGLQLVSYMYVGFKIIEPSLDVGFDLENEYKEAMKLFEG